MKHIQIDGDSKSSLNNLLVPIANVLRGNFDICYGQFTGDELNNNPSANNMCGNSYLDSNSKFSTVGFSVNGLPCGIPSTMVGCFAFDGCGTFYANINGPTLNCLATFVSGGIAEIVAPLSGSLSALGFGYSRQRRFTNEMKIAVRKGEDSIELKDITTRAHFMFSTQITLPLDYKIGGVKLGDIFSFNISGVAFIDFGPAESAVSNLIGIMNKPNGSKFNDIVNTVIKTGAEISATVTGTISINLSDITRGFLNNIILGNLFNCNLLLTSGGPNSSSGLPTGIYVFFDGSMFKDFAKIIESLTGKFADILKLLGIKLPSIPNFGKETTFSVFIDKTNVGFRIEISNFKFMCLFQYENSSGSCCIDGKCFSGFSGTVGMIIKEAKKFFDNTGKEITKIAQNAEQEINKAAKQAEQKINVIAQATKEEAEKLGRHMKDQANKVLNSIKEEANRVANQVKEGLENLGNDFKKFFKI
jgi:hypothetical protein